MKYDQNPGCLSMAIPFSSAASALNTFQLQRDYISSIQFVMLYLNMESKWSKKPTSYLKLRYSSKKVRFFSMSRWFLLHCIGINQLYFLFACVGNMRGLFLRYVSQISFQMNALFWIYWRVKKRWRSTINSDNLHSWMPRNSRSKYSNWLKIFLHYNNLQASLWARLHPEIQSFDVSSYALEQIDNRVK